MFVLLWCAQRGVELLRDQNVHAGSKRHPPLGVPAGGHREAGRKESSPRHDEKRKIDFLSEFFSIKINQNSF